MLRFLFRVFALAALCIPFFAFPVRMYAAPCPAPAPGETDITGEGSVFASTVFPGYSASLGVDCDTTTSWFSTGPEPNNQPTIYRWTGAREDKITTIFVQSNGDHPQFPTDFGFGRVTVRVRNAAGDVVYEESVPLPGTPDPTLVLHPNVMGKVVELLYSGHESPDCGGMSELRIYADRTPPTASPPTAVPPTAKAPTAIPPTSAPTPNLPPPTPNLPPPLTAVPTTSVVEPGTPLVSDDLNRPDAPPCGIGPARNSYGGSRQLFFMPIFPSGGTDASNPIGAKLLNGALENNGLDFGGFQFVSSDACAVARGLVRGADMGQDLNLRTDLIVPTNAAGLMTQAGPYIRSRAAAIGDGIIGGDSAGYWVQLQSSGEIKLKRLNPFSEIASTCKPASFDASATHILEIAAGGNQLQVALDGRLQTFQQTNQFRTAVPIPATSGSNDGTAGIAFGAEQNRGLIGGQRADNIVVTSYRALDALPAQNNCVVAPTPTTTTNTGSPTGSATTSPLTPTLIAAVATQTAASAPSTRGDCDNDGKLTELDALCALEISVGLRASLPQMDLDGDGVVTSRDVVLVLQRVVGQ